MPYGEKLKMIKEARHLTVSQVAKICDITLPTATRVFSEKNLSGNFETFVSIARGLNISLDELAGLKPPIESPDSNLLLEKDMQIDKLTKEINAYKEYINAMKEDNATLKEDNKTLREDNNSLRKDNKTLRREKVKIFAVLIVLLIALAAWFIVDLSHGHFGIFRF